MKGRAYSLDALRGYAILTMVLSATVAGSILPAWMYHAQTPPPTHAFNPELPGLTWVDLVFPFFLFAMGAAFPFSIRKRKEKGESELRLVYDALKRGVQLTFFAIFIQHFYPYMLSSPQDMRAWLLAIACFAVLFPMFMRLPFPLPAWGHTAVKLGAYVVAVVMLLTVNYADGREFSLYTSNIIILLLANMAIFGSIIYLFTMDNKWARIAVLLVLAGIILSSEVEGSWTSTLFGFTPVPWMYRFDYLKYLFIVLPGSLAGDFLLEWMNRRGHEEGEDKNDRKAYAALFLSVAIIVCNLVGLYNRWLHVNLVVNILLLLAGWWLLRKSADSASLWKELFNMGAFLLLVGLCLEPFQGGIKKDVATFSYFFVTSGLACMALIAFHILCDYFHCRKSTSWLVMSGQNPMIAYVAGDLLVIPVLQMTGLFPLLSYLHSNPWLGFLQGLLLTSLSLLVTIFFTRIKWFWRT